jgi:hypothetical protein
MIGMKKKISNDQGIKSWVGAILEGRSERGNKPFNLGLTIVYFTRMMNNFVMILM